MEAHLAVITALSLLGYVCISFAHLDLGSFSHSSLQICSSSVKLDGERRWTAIFKSFHRFSMGFNSGVSSSTPEGFSCSCSDAISVLLWLYAWCHCPVGTETFATVFCTLKHVLLKDLLVFGSIHCSLYPDKSPSPCHWKVSPQYDAAPTMLLGKDGVRCLMSCARFPPVIVLSIRAKEFNFHLIRPQILLPHSSQSFTCLFANSRRAVIFSFFFSGVASGLLLSQKA